LYKNSDFLIVDEPTSALDDITAEKVIDALIESFSTIVIVSHKKEILKKCNNLIEIK
jgi:ATP-binding cassette subfamily B protein